MSDNKDVLEEQYILIKLNPLTNFQRDGIIKKASSLGIKGTEAVVIEKDWPGYEVAVGIAKHGRICRRLSACDCKGQEKRDACFDWVKV